MPYIDIHTHVNLAAFAEDREAATARALEAGVAHINVGTQLKTSQAAIDVAEDYEADVYATVGLHPVHTSASYHDTQEFGDGYGKAFTSTGEEFDYDAYKKMAKHRKVVAIGECGLDFYRAPTEEEWRKQVEVFEMQITLANEVQKPLMLHLRSGNGRNAYKEAQDILKRSAHVLGNSHFFAGSLDDARGFWDMGYTTSFTGVLTFTHDYDEVVKAAPLSMLHAETDAPYVAPVPHRGERNEPSYVIEVVKKIAEIRGKDIEIVSVALYKNARRLFLLA